MTTVTIAPGPKNARTDPTTQLRYYGWQGRELPSVTSIRRMAGIPFGLHNWSITEVIDHVIDHAFIISDRLEGLNGKEPEAEAALIRHELRAAATAKRDAAGALGTAVHDAAASGKHLLEVDVELQPRLAQYLDWVKVSGAAIIAAEFQVFNLTVGYAGTVDLLVQQDIGEGGEHLGLVLGDGHVCRLPTWPVSLLPEQA